MADSLIAFHQDLFTSSNLVSNWKALSPVEKNCYWWDVHSAFSWAHSIGSSNSFKANGSSQSFRFGRYALYFLPNYWDLTNRLKNHLIYDVILVAFETIHSMHNLKSGKTWYMALKLDMSKPWVEWGFLEEVRIRWKWITLMMTWLEFVSYPILLNGEPKGLIKPTRGIRQEIHFLLFFSSFALRVCIV